LLRFARNDDLGTSPRFRRNISDPCAVRRDVVMAIFEVHALVRRRLGFGADARPPRFHGADWPWGKTAAAIRADVLQFALGAIRAKRTFIAANAGVRCAVRQILVAIFAVRSELQGHNVDSLLRGCRLSRIQSRARWRISLDLRPASATPLAAA
jgi:hypothetical protein